MTNVFLYARVATKNLAKRSQSIEDQLAAMRQYVDANGWEVAGEYVDEGLSGMTDQRPAFQQMIKDALSGCPDLILVHSVNRLFRNHFLIEKYRRKLEKQGIQISSLTDELGMNESQNLMIAITSAFDEYYKRERARRRNAAR